MLLPKARLIAIAFVSLWVIAPRVRAQEAGQSEREAMYHRYLDFASYVKGGSITPHWMADGSSFWYTEGAPASTIIYKVDPKADTKTPLFDTARLRNALTPLLGHEPPYQGLPFADFIFMDSEKAVKFAVEDKEFILQLDTYMIDRVLGHYLSAAPGAQSDEERTKTVPQVVRKGFFSYYPPIMELPSPDGRWFAGIQDHNLSLRSTYDGRSVKLTDDGVQDFEWDVEGAKWSPDSLKLAVKKGDSRQVSYMPIVHWLKPQEELEWIHYSRAGEPLPQLDLYIVDVLSKRRTRVDTGKEADQYMQILGWQPDGSGLLLLRMNREFNKLDLLAADPATGATRVVLTETSKTFLIGIQFRWVDWVKWSGYFTWLPDGKRFLWMSEKDGWNYLYLYDLKGNLIRRLNEDNFPVVHAEAVDEKNGWVYFTGHGDQKQPYDTQLYRVNLEGKQLGRLTEGPGLHGADWNRIQFAPSKEFFLDTHSSVDQPPVVELRRADGTLIQTLAKADIGALKELKWKPPEEFVVKAEDEKTDLYGVLYKPYDFDPNKKYPVIDVIYAGPYTSVVTHDFIPWGESNSAIALAQLGFVTFVVDGRGTPERGKAFQDVVYGNFGRSEIPDHLATLKQLAASRPYMDLSRAGVYGHSWGGYFAIRAMLLAPDVYRVGVASSPNVALSDFRVSVEPYMGLPQSNRDAYEYGSNLRLAGNLKGKLLLIHGTSDDDVPFAETMKMVEALIRAGKPYDLFVLPEMHHDLWNSKAYWETVGRYFQEHLKP